MPQPLRNIERLPVASAGSETPHQDEEFIARVRSEASAYLKARPGRSSQAKIARAVGVSDSAVSQFLSGQYHGDMKHVAHLLDGWLSLQVRRADALIEPVYVQTRISAWIREAIEIAHEMRTAAIIYGAAGVGKSRTAEQYRDVHPGSVLYCFSTQATRNPHGFMVGLAEQLKAPTSYTLKRTEDEIVRRLADTDRMLIIDEAERLAFRTLDEIQAVQERSKIGVAYLADEVLWKTITSQQTHAEHARFLSRVNVLRPVVEAIGQVDVERIARQFTVHTDPGCMTYLTNVAQGDGGFRAVVNYCRLAIRNSRLDGRTEVAIGDFEAAHETLRPTMIPKEL